MVGNPPSIPMYDVLPVVKPDIIALGYDQEHAETAIRAGLDERGHTDIKLVRVEGLTEDLDGTRKIIDKILTLQWAQKRLDEIEKEDA
jgi:glycerol-3-phosphate cytidylyltransferase-like family protein